MGCYAIYLSLTVVLENFFIFPWCLLPSSGGGKNILQKLVWSCWSKGALCKIVASGSQVFAAIIFIVNVLHLYSTFELCNGTPKPLILVSILLF